MSLTQTVVIEVRNASGQVVGTETATVTGDVEQEFSVQAPAADSVTVALAVTAADIVGFAIVSTRAVTLTVNDDGTPDETYTLAAGQVFAWNSGQEVANPITHNITSLKFANAGASAAEIRGVFLTA